MTIELILISLSLLLMFHYILFIGKINTGLKSIEKTIEPINISYFVSVIIPFRNEEENILESLQCFQNLNYPPDKYEVIFVNDSSEDNGAERLRSANNSPNIKIIDAPASGATRGHKKHAVLYGIKNANGAIIVTTDADCTFGKEWLNNLLACFDDETGFVSGPVKFTRSIKIFQRIQTLEFAGLVLTGAGLIGCNRPVICNAANVAYRKEVFEMVNGFDDNLNLSSGDDELLMQKIAADTNYKVKFCFNKDAVVETKPNNTLAAFVQQRRRWASKSIFYKEKLLVVQLVLIYLFYVALLMLPFAALFVSGYYLLLFVAGFAAKACIENTVMRKGKKLFDMKYNLSDFLAAELFQVIYIVIISAAGLWGGFKWKERKLAR